MLTAEQLVEDPLLKSSPGIYQELVPKAYELRITMMGRKAFVAKVLSQETEGGKLDWRKSYAELKMESFAVSQDVADACFRLLERLGIVFGCFDFIVTPEGETIFLEVNEMGQFLFVENYTGVPLLDAFCEFLLQASVGFTWRPDQVQVRYPDVREEVVVLAAREAEKHRAPRDLLVREEEQGRLALHDGATRPSESRVIAGRP
jgi:hypothetical protein